MSAKEKIGHNPRKYNEEVHEKIVDAIREGNNKTVAFKLAGLYEGTAFDWITMGERNPEKYPEYVKLKEDIVQAEAEFEATRVALVKTAADTGTWQAAAWFLERKNPEEWGRNRDPRPETPAIGQQVNVLILEDPDARQASRELLRGLAAGRADITLGPGDVRELAENEEG